MFLTRSRKPSILPCLHPKIYSKGGENKQGEGEHGEDELTFDGGEDGKKNNNWLLKVND
jgi:hypothetical protein